MKLIPRSKPSLSSARNALLIAHRGVHDKAIENTHTAFLRAKELGCWGIEFDVRCTGDGVFVVNHDPDLNRLWGLDVRIADIAFSDLRRLVPDIPSLQEVVECYASSMHLFVELKEVAHQSKLLEALGPCKPQEGYHLLTLDPLFFDSLDLIPKTAMLLVAAHNNVAEFCNLSLAQGYGGVLANYLLLSDRLLSQLKQAQKKAGVGFVNSKNSLYRELNRNMEWLFTNSPLRIEAHLRELLKVH